MHTQRRHEGEADIEAIGYFGPESMVWRIGGEAALLAGGGRAVLMQLAHPLVAAGVGQHSSWAQDPWGRTYRTVELIQQLTFGTVAEARSAARFINRLHADVSGTTSWETDSLLRATPYRARDAELLFWVLATLIDTALLIYPLLVGPLTHAEQEQYYRESVQSATLLGMPASIAPASLAGFRDYMGEMLASDSLAVTTEAVRVARVVMHMPAPLILRPVLLAAEQVTIGLLPPRIRGLYGFEWGGRRQLLLNAWAASTRGVYRRLPRAVRMLPAARAAWRRLQAPGAVQRTE
jgi:uncharacterized protein (DUF2236 family)